MAAVSLGLGALSLVLMVAGFLTTGVPYLGASLSFAAPVAALAGLITGGISLSRAKEAQESTTLPVVSLIMNGVFFLLALLVALTCGLCNALITASPEGSGLRPGPRPDGSVSLLEQRMLEAQRFPLTMTLGSALMNCDTQGNANQYFFPEMAGRYGSRFCAMSQEEHRGFSRPCTEGPPCSEVISLSLDLEQLAVQQGVDPDDCLRLQSGEATVTGCPGENGYRLFAVGGLQAWDAVEGESPENGDFEEEPSEGQAPEQPSDVAPEQAAGEQGAE